jgi:hypothetical protein
MIKYLLLLLMILCGASASAQKITGVVLDKSTQQAIAGASVTFEGRTTGTNVMGIFEINARSVNDTLKVTETGYKPIAVLITKNNLNIRIELESSTISLNNVNIFGTHSFKLDSLANRDEYAKQFNYTPPKLKDVIGLPTGDRPGQLLSIDVLALVRYLTYKSTTDYKFKQVLIRDEHEQFVDEKFNRGNVSRITKMKGDTLLSFLATYRPTYEFVLKSTGYDMEIYIAQSFAKFKKDGFPIRNPFVVKN